MATCVTRTHETLMVMGNPHGTVHSEIKAHRPTMPATRHDGTHNLLHAWWENTARGGVATDDPRALFQGLAGAACGPLRRSAQRSRLVESERRNPVDLCAAFRGPEGDGSRRVRGALACAARRVGPVSSRESEQRYRSITHDARCDRRTHHTGRRGCSSEIGGAWHHRSATQTGRVGRQAPDVDAANDHRGTLGCFGVGSGRCGDAACR